MNIRKPVRAGSFYDATTAGCRRHAEQLLEAAELPADLPEKIYGGIVPHAGWVFSGQVAALTLKACCAAGEPDTFVLFGADHSGTVQKGEVYASGAWGTPLGEVKIDEQLATAAMNADDRLRENPEAHSYEHSLEVQVPLIQIVAPKAKILPIGVPPVADAVEIGRSIAKVIAERPAKTAVIGSTDLTHHGGHFPSPGGRGKTGAEWTKENDFRIIKLFEQVDADAVISEASERMNACGAGAAAAAVAACRQLGAERGILLRYTNSYEVIHATYPNDPDDTTVGYASVVFA